MQMTNTTYIWLRQCLVHANVLPYHGYLDLRGTPCLEERTGPQSACQLGKCHPTDICSVKPSESLMVIGYDYMITAFEKMNNLQLVFHGLLSLTCRLQGGYRPLPPSVCQRSPTFCPITSTIPSIIRMSVELTELWKIPKHAKKDKTYMYT